MFAIANDRKSLWQWDLNQQLTVAGDCTEVHYLDKGAPSTLTVAVKDGKADIPNILLQKAGRLVVYAYIIDAQDHHTKVCETFGIAPRPKPTEYVYTETEVKTWSDLQSQIGNLANLETKAKENLVAAVNEAAKSGGAENAVLYTAQSLTEEQKAQARANIGAGTPYTLLQATAEAIGGVKADPATADDTQPVRIGNDGKLVTAAGKSDISLGLTSVAVGQIIKVKAIDASGKPTAWEAANMPSGGGGGTSEEFILLAEVTLEEDVKKVTLPLSSPTKHFITRMWCPKTSATSDPTYLSIGINGSSSNLLYYLAGNLPSKNNKSQCTVEAHGLNDGNWAISAYTNFGDAEGAVSNYNQHTMIPIGVKNNGIMQAESVVFDVITNDATQYFPVGSILRVWGV